MITNNNNNYNNNNGNISVELYIQVIFFFVKFNLHVSKLREAKLGHKQKKLLKAACHKYQQMLQPTKSQDQTINTSENF